MKRASIVLALGLSALGLLSACDRTHMSPNFGERNRAAMKAQVIDPKAGYVAKPDPPLDPEEAAVVSRTYLKGLSKETAEVPRAPILIAPPLNSGAIGPGPVPTPGTGAR